MYIKRAEYVEVNIPTGNTKQQIYFPDLPNLRNAKITSIQIYTTDTISATPLTGATPVTIADLKKSEVYLIGQELGINNDIILAPPTDGLWGDDKTDEDQIGATYPELEWAMEFSDDEKKLSKREIEVLKIFKNLNKKIEKILFYFSNSIYLFR